MARKPPSAITMWSQYLAARLAVMGMSIFDVEVNLKVAGQVGRILHHVDRRHRERALRAIQQSFPDFTPQQADKLAREAFEHFIQLVIEMVFSTRLIHRDSWSERIVLDESLQPGIAMFNAGQPAIFVTGHVGNWEVLGNILATLGYRMDAVARPLDNPLINDWVLGLREMRGMRIITKWNAADRLLQSLQQGRALGFIADQNAGERGMFVPFFGRLASTYKSIALLAVSQNVPVVCGYAYRLEQGYRYRFGQTDVIYPEDWADHPDPVYYVTARYMRGIETMVRLCPAQYMWMHRRWKCRPRHELEDKPMPPAMMRRLSSLPWLTAADIESIDAAGREEARLMQAGLR